jgi:hypothetical protein
MARIPRFGLIVSYGLVLGANACSGSRATTFPQAQCPQEPAASQVTVDASLSVVNVQKAPVPSVSAEALRTGEPEPGVSGSWLWSCCDAKNTWIGMLVLVQTGKTLHGAFLTDGDSHGSYLDGSIEGRVVQLVRRWQTGAVLHEQFYTLTLEADGQRLTGTFTEPAFDPLPHAIHIERGFSSAPRLPLARPITKPSRDPIEAILGEGDDGRDPKRPCDCHLVCYCGGVPPGAEHYRESARCGSACKCRVCPPIP